MVAVAEVLEIFAEPGSHYRFCDLLVGLSCKSDAEQFFEFAVPPAFFSKDFPQDVRISVRGKQSGVCYAEIFVPLRFHRKIIFVKAVGNKLHLCRGHRLEFVLDQRRDSNDYRGIIQNHLLKSGMFALRPRTESQMLEIEHLCPRVPEVCNPWNAC